MRFFFSLLLVITIVFSLSAQEVRDMDWYLQETETAVKGERYEYAVSILTEARDTYPDASVFSAMLGDLYYDKELYSLALKEYRQAQSISPEDYAILYSIATTEGRLNLDFESVATLESILELYPDSLDVIIDLGWMYFKTFQLARGERILLEALETFGDSKGLCMTLGTIYAGMYDYEKAEEYYCRSIDLAIDTGELFFASVAYYNLSLLQQGFYRFDEALDSTQRSIEAAERASGHIALGELYQLRAEYGRARDEYSRAYDLDTTPLAMVNLADLNLEMGNPHEALAYLEEVMHSPDHSWMYYFGTDIKRHRLELHRIYGEVYLSLAKGALKESSRGLQRLISPIKSLRFRALAWYHTRKYRTLCLDVGTSYLEDGNELDANWYFYKGNVPYHQVALKYLDRAEAVETSIAPEAAPYYLLERGTLLSDRTVLFAALRDLENHWERGARVETLGVLLQKAGGRSGRGSEDLFRELFLLHPGAFIRYGLNLPVYIEGDVPRSVRRYLKHSNFRIVRSRDYAAFTLTLSPLDTGRTAVTLIDPDSGQNVITKTISYSIQSRKAAFSLVADIVAQLFNFD